MKNLFVIGLLSLAAMLKAANSEHLFPQGGGAFPGAAGPLVFSGDHFVTPAVQANGAISLTFLNTNAAFVSSHLLSVTGSAPTIVAVSDGCVLAWLGTNAQTRLLNCARWSGGVLGPVSVLASNVEERSVCLSRGENDLLLVWQEGTSNQLYGRTLGTTGAPIGNTFEVAGNSSARMFPAVANDGTNYLVCWVEQETVSNTWQVVARQIASGAPAGAAVVISQTNSIRPYPVACCFGTNYLIVWSSDHGFPTFGQFGPTNIWVPALHGRLFSGLPVNDEFVVGANLYWNTNAAVAFGAGRYVVAWANGDGYQWAQPLEPNGSRVEAEFFISYVASAAAPQLAYGGGAFCLTFQKPGPQSESVGLFPQTMPRPELRDLRRASDGLSVVSDVFTVQISTNFVDWQSTFASELYRYNGLPKLFVRAVNDRWTCTENMNLIWWAKQRWAFDHMKSQNDQPSDADLFGPSNYLPAKPSCPSGGTYSINGVGYKPACSVGGHTF